MNISLSYSEFLQDNYISQSSADRTSNQGLKIHYGKNCQIVPENYEPFVPSKLAKGCEIIDKEIHQQMMFG